MPLTAEHKAGGTGIAYINTTQTDRVFRAPNVAFIRSNVSLEEMRDMKEGLPGRGRMWLLKTSLC